MGAEDDSIERVAAIQALAAAAEPFADARRLLLETTGIGVGDAVLEIGCGVLPAAEELLRRVGDGGRVTGLDSTTRLLVHARRRSGARVRLVAGDAEAAPFADATFDVVLLDKVLVHLERPRRALAEAVRTLRPGGRLGAFEWDLTGLAVEGAGADLERILAEVQRLTTASPEAPTRLDGWLRDAGLEDVRRLELAVEGRRLDRLWRAFLHADLEAARRLDLADEEQTDAWWETLERRSDAGEFRAATGGVVASGRRPTSMDTRGASPGRPDPESCV